MMTSQALADDMFATKSTSNTRGLFEKPAAAVTSLSMSVQFRVSNTRVILVNFLRRAVWWRRFVYNVVDRTAEVTYCRLPSPESWLLATVKASPLWVHPAFASHVTPWSVHKLQAPRYHYHIIIAIIIIMLCCSCVFSFCHEFCK